MSLTHRGVNYDTGTNYMSDGSLSRLNWDADVMREEVRVIRDELHCTSIGVFGSDHDRLAETAEAALEGGLQVWLQPRLVDAGPRDTLAHLAKTAALAERLRTDNSAIHLNVGCELTIFSAGLMPGAGYAERIALLTKVRGWSLLPLYNKRLNRFLRQAADVARVEFHGPLTYGAGLWESVDWKPFDIIGLDYYRMSYNRAKYVTKLRKFTRQDKPVVIVEFGCAAFDGAAEAGPTAHEIIDYSGPVPRIDGTYTRNEQVQADQLADLIGIYDEEGVHGAFVFEFVEPGHPHSAEPHEDVDMAGYSLVKIIHDTPDGPYRREPKAAFHAVAKLYDR
jgi:hypothetical protein